MGHVNNPFHGPLWFMGIAQSYQLFDWIDDRNFYISYDVMTQGTGQQSLPADSMALFPNTVRSILLQSYLHGVTWLRIPTDFREELSSAIIERFTSRFCRTQSDLSVEVFATVQRIDRSNLDLSKGMRRHFLSFECHGGQSRLIYPTLTNLQSGFNNGEHLSKLIVN